MGSQFAFFRSVRLFDYIMCRRILVVVAENILIWYEDTKKE